MLMVWVLLFFGGVDGRLWVAAAAGGVRCV